MEEEDDCSNKSRWGDVATTALKSDGTAGRNGSDENEQRSSRGGSCGWEAGVQPGDGAEGLVGQMTCSPT